MPKEFVITAPDVLEFRPYSDPPLKSNEVRVKSLISGIKQGTELNLFCGTTPFLNNVFDMEYRLFLPSEKGELYPTRLGSWLCGQVIEIGDQVHRFKTGDLVHGWMPHRPTNNKPEAELYRLADNMLPECSLFTDPAHFALGAIHDAQIKVGDRVAVFGLGVIGLLVVQIARLNGAEAIFGVDKYPKRLELARQFGADMVFNASDSDPSYEIKKLTEKKGVDVAIEFSGSLAGLQSAIRCVHVDGLVVSGGYYKPDQTINLGAEWHHNRITLRSSMPDWDNPHRCHPMWDSRRVEQTAVRLLENGKLNVLPMITHRFPYEEATEAYEMIKNHPNEVVKVLFEY